MTEELGVGGEVWSLFCTERDWGVDCATEDYSISHRQARSSEA